jgi:hypothetical protein
MTLSIGAEKVSTVSTSGVAIMGTFLLNV